MTGSTEGLLLVDKPGGPTSHDVVSRVRRALGGVRTGHAGTLDPYATGLLPLVLGRATRLVRFLQAEPKTYAGQLELGVVTSTDDVTGEVRSRSVGPPPPPSAVAKAAARLLGRSLQVPPSVSARRLEGERMYRRARRGEELAPPATEIEVVRFDVEATDDPALWSFEAVVSSGTYIRALARDLGAMLGCGGAVRSLRRTAIGSMSVEEALVIEPSGPLDADRLIAATIPIARMPLEPPACVLSVEAASRFVSGLPVPCPTDGPGDGPLRVLGPDAVLLGIGEVQGALLQPRVVVAEWPGRTSLPAPRPL